MNYLQFNDKGKFGPEEQTLANYFDSIKQSYRGFYKKHFLRDRFQITKDDFISGDVDVIFHAMRRLGIEYSYNDYPDKLKPYLHRKIWEDRLGNIKKELFEEGYLKNPIFIKPKDNLKRFTGFVLETIDDLPNCKGAGNQTKIWCSEPVKFVEEFRVYRLFKHESTETTFSFGCYKKDYSPQSLRQVMEFVKELPSKAMIELPSACAIDIGILSTGEIALIEINDAFSLGLYESVRLKNGENPVKYNRHYCECLVERWEELKGKNEKTIC